MLNQQHKSNPHKSKKKMLKEAKKFLKRKLKEEGSSCGLLRPVPMVSVASDFKVQRISPPPLQRRSNDKQVSSSVVGYFCRLTF